MLSISIDRVNSYLWQANRNLQQATLKWQFTVGSDDRFWENGKGVEK